ncbi:hypothetical protein [Sphingomonas sp.]|uniref:hypothetical protein n=1 Tax=Sphingomonas sp. TaxID=28214 RepID=UPI003B000F49
MKVILEFPTVDGIPTDFEALPEVGETIISGGVLGEAKSYKVVARLYAYSQLSQTMCPVLKLVEEQSTDEWIASFTG